MTAFLLNLFTIPSDRIFSWGSAIRGWGISCGLIYLLGGTVGMVLISGCNQISIRSVPTWSTYQNSRYQFEFPYPNDWVMEQDAEDLDGEVFSSPKHPRVTIRGWASQIPTTGIRLDGASTQSLQSNFMTQQGLPGHLQVEVNSEMSSVTLTILHDGLLYGWKGQSPSDQLANYYQFFNYIASHYRIPM